MKINALLACGLTTLACQLTVINTSAWATTAADTERKPVDVAKAQISAQTSAEKPIDADLILTYFPMRKANSAPDNCLSESANKPFLTHRFGMEGRCKRVDDNSRDCAYRDYRKQDLSAIAGVDQRGITSYQVTYPGTEHLWAALSVNNRPESVFCWVGGAHVGQNPLTMTWGGETGTKSRKNNFILSESGRIQVEAARIHNLHDVFLAADADAGFSVNRSWITWNRDDTFEGYLQNLSFTDTLIDGTYTFISDPDGDCDAAKKAADRTIVIENSLIRLQRQPGPYGRHTGKWDWAVEGGHNTLWKLDSCDWDEWPAFILKNNVFLIEGPRTTFRELNTLDCRLALPGDCADPAMKNVAECHNNLFLYTDYHHWRNAGTAPGPTPQAGNRFYNASNPTYLPNGRDCYQRLTDDRPGTGTADVEAIWRALRQQWIDWHTDDKSVSIPLMTIAGVDYPVFPSGSKIKLINRGSGQCMAATDTQSIGMQDCKDSAQQVFTVAGFDDGSLAAALLLKHEESGFLRSEPTASLEKTTDRRRPVAILGGSANEGQPAFDERWYIAPLPDTAATQGYFYIETDALQRTFLQQTGDEVSFQALFPDGVETALPQGRFKNGNDHNLQWSIQLAEKLQNEH